MARRINSDILTRFEDALGKWRESPQETIAAIAAAMGKPPPEAKPAVMVVRRGQRRPLRAAARITLDDGAVLCVRDARVNLRALALPKCVKALSICKRAWFGVSALTSGRGLATGTR